MNQNRPSQNILQTPYYPIKNPTMNYQGYGSKDNNNNTKIQNFIDQRNQNFKLNQDFNNNMIMDYNVDMYSNIGKYGGINPQIPNNLPNMMGQNMKKNNQNNIQHNNIYKNQVNINNKMRNNPNNKYEEMGYGDIVIKKVKPNENIPVENKGNPLENCEEISMEDNEEDLQFSPSKSSNVKI